MAETANALRRVDFARLARWGGGVALAASLAFIAERLWRLDWSALTPHLSWKLAVAATAAAAVFALADHALAMAWARLADPERTLSSRQAARIYGQGVLMKYLPGSVFQYVGRQVGGSEAGLAQGVLVRSSVTEVGLHLVASMSVASGCLLFGTTPVGAMVAAVLLLGACLALRRPLALALALQVIAFAGFAVAAVLVGWAVLPADAGLARFAALFLLAWLAGFVVPVAPGGLGVREAALLALAGASLPAAGLLAAVLVLRIASIGGDLTYGLIALVRGRVRNP